MPILFSEFGDDVFGFTTEKQRNTKKEKPSGVFKGGWGDRSGIVPEVSNKNPIQSHL
jgi:hypothetical protein